MCDRRILQVTPQGRTLRHGSGQALREHKLRKVS